MKGLFYMQIKPHAYATRWCAVWAACLLMVVPWSNSWAFTVSIGSAARSMFLQVGTGSISGGTFSGGGVPQNNSTVNTVSADVPASTFGTGAAIGMTTSSTVTNSPYDNFTFCPNLGNQVYVGGFYRSGGFFGGAATLTAQSPPSLSTTGGDSIPFSSISWQSSGAQDTGTTIPASTFVGGTQTIYNASNNTWFESCLNFRYANSAIVPAGTYSGRVTYTLTAP